MCFIYHKLGTFSVLLCCDWGKSGGNYRFIGQSLEMVVKNENKMLIKRFVWNEYRSADQNLKLKLQSLTVSNTRPEYNRITELNY